MIFSQVYIDHNMMCVLKFGGKYFLNDDFHELHEVPQDFAEKHVVFMVVLACT